MFPNSNTIICSSYTQFLDPLSEILPISTIPYNFQRKTDRSFILCDSKDDITTHILEISFSVTGQINKKSVQQFMGNYEYSCFGDDHALLVSRDGDMLYYNFINQNVFLMDKQHPSLFSMLQIHNVDSVFITCGGNVKNSNQQSQKIIKVWVPNMEDELIMKKRIVTGHTKTVQSSTLLGRNKIVTLSTDKTVRTINLSTGQLQSIIPVDIDLYSAYALDWNTVMVAGIGSKINIYDTRNKKLIRANDLSREIIQISKICRLTQYSYILSNINQLLVLHLRKFVVDKKNEYKGERICEIATISDKNIVFGNRDKTLQIWSCS